MHHVPEIGVETVGAGIDVFLEQLAEGDPELGGGGGIAEDEIEDLGGDSHVDPLDDSEIILDPLWVMRLRDSGGGDVITEIASPEVDVEEVAPMVVVVGGKI